MGDLVSNLVRAYVVFEILDVPNLEYSTRERLKKHVSIIRAIIFYFRVTYTWSTIINILHQTDTYQRPTRNSIANVEKLKMLSLLAHNYHGNL